MSTSMLRLLPLALLALGCGEIRTGPRGRGGEGGGASEGGIEEHDIDACGRCAVSYDCCAPGTNRLEGARQKWRACQNPISTDGGLACADVDGAPACVPPDGCPAMCPAGMERCPPPPGHAAG